MSESGYVVKLKLHQVPRRTSVLGQMDIELTERCNNACIHCLINQPENDLKSLRREMTTEFIKDILSQAADLGCLTVRFTGGEPLLRDDFPELYLFTRRLGMQVILFTNARLITSEIARLFSRIPPGRVIEVTVYGMHTESYDAATATKGAFAEFWHGLELLREYKIPFVIKQSVLPSNRHEIAEFEAFAATLPYMDNPPGYAMNFDLRARRDNPSKNRFIQTLRLTPAETITMLARNPNYMIAMQEFCGKFMGPSGDKLFNCGAGQGTCVDAYGNAQMCMGLRDPALVYDLHTTYRSNQGSLRESDPQPIDQKNNSQFSLDSKPVGNEGLTPLKYALTELFPHLREIRATNPDYLNRCARCFLKGLCEQCPAKSWEEHGNLDTPVEYLCDVAHAQARYLGLLASNELAWEIEPEVSKDRVAQFVKKDSTSPKTLGKSELN